MAEKSLPSWKKNQLCDDVVLVIFPLSRHYVRLSGALCRWFSRLKNILSTNIFIPRIKAHLFLRHSVVYTKNFENPHTHGGYHHRAYTQLHEEGWCEGDAARLAESMPLILFFPW